MILYFKTPKNSTPKLLDTINSFSNVAVYKIDFKIQYHFYTPTMNKLRKNIRKQFNNGLKNVVFMHNGVLFNHKEE
jgi:hypothetical protein